MIRRGCAHGFEEGASLFQCADEGFIIYNIDIADFTEFIDVRFPIGRVEINDTIGTEGWEDASVPATLTNSLVMFECIRRCIGGAQDFDIEALEELARRKFRGG